jgi:hypothetical protein
VNDGGVYGHCVRIEHMPQASGCAPVFSMPGTGLTACTVLRFEEKNKSSIVTFIPNISAKEHDDSAVLRKGSVFLATQDSK